MGQLVCGGAMLKCSFGVAPCSLMVLPVNRMMKFELSAKGKRELATLAYLKNAGFGLENLDELKTKLIQLIIDTTIQSASE